MKKEYRIKRNEDFGRIISKRKSVANQCFILYRNPNDIGHCRVGISVSKKLGNAVVRNTIKRQVRCIINETFDMQEKYDYVIIVRDKFKKMTYQKNTIELMYLLQKIKKDGKANVFR